MSKTQTPDRWLQGRTLILQRDNPEMGFREAYARAVEDWNEQERMEREKKEALARVRRHANNWLPTHLHIQQESSQ